MPYSYHAPDVGVVDGDFGQEEDEIVMFAVVLGGLIVGIAAFLARCNALHGHPQISIGWGRVSFTCVR